MAARLTVLSGPFSGRVIEIGDAKFLIGREEDCNLRPDSRLVSRHHCVFLQDGFTLRVRDMGSRNGTFVNGSRIKGAVSVQDGDVVSIGEMTLKVALSASAADRASAETPKTPLSSTDVFDGETLQGQSALTNVPHIGETVTAKGSARK